MFNKRIKRLRFKPVTVETNMETPVTPPSINLLGKRNPFSPKQAEEIESITQI
jgi:hypothetical protein